VWSWKCGDFNKSNAHFLTKFQQLVVLQNAAVISSIRKQRQGNYNHAYRIGNRGNRSFKSRSGPQMRWVDTHQGITKFLSNSTTSWCRAIIPWWWGIPYDSMVEAAIATSYPARYSDWVLGKVSEEMLAAGYFVSARGMDIRSRIVRSRRHRNSSLWDVHSRKVEYFNCWLEE
jgi:hypothetical protein